MSEKEVQDAEMTNTVTDIDVTPSSEYKEEAGITSKEFNCPICFSNVPTNEVFCLKQCGCEFCTACLSEFVQLQIRERLVHRLKCPGLHVNDMPIKRSDVKHLVSHQDFITYIRLIHEKVLLKDPSRIYCPFPNCGSECYSKRAGPLPIRCMACGFKFCRLCHQSWPGSNHVCPEEIELLTKRTEVQETVTTENETESNKSTAKDIAAEIHSDEKNKKLAIKRCPECGVPIERAAGCYQIFCMSCGHSFCWSCMTSLDNESYVQHIERGVCTNPSVMAPYLNGSLGQRCLDCFVYTGIFSCLGCLGLLCAPLTIIFSPCLAAFLPRAIARVYINNEILEPALTTNVRISAPMEEETDSEVDLE